MATKPIKPPTKATKAPTPTTGSSSRTDSVKDRTELRKLKNVEVDGLKGKLLEVRRIGAHPIFVSIEKADTIESALEKADIPIDSRNEIKVEALKDKSTKWESVALGTKAFDFARIAVTTKVRGSC